MEGIPPARSPSYSWGTRSHLVFYHSVRICSPNHSFLEQSLSLSARSAAGGMHETPNVPAVPTSYPSTRECSQMVSSPPYHSIPHEWSIRLTPVSTAVSCSLSRSSPSARPLLERSSSPSLRRLSHRQIKDHYLPEKAKIAWLENRIWFVSAVLSDWEY